jgi:amidase
MMTDLAWLDATAQHDLVVRREVSPTELVDAAIARIEALNPIVNAVIHERFDQARKDASSPELPDGPFRGVPVLLKDLGCPSAGDPNHQGNRLLKRIDHREAEDGNLTRRIRRAGMVILGRTNVPEFGLVSTTEPAAYGPTRNPWDLDRSPGGSSGGSAAAVAAGLVAIAQGTDGGGSIRMPAAHCGLFGLKVSRGRISPGPQDGDSLAAHNVYGFLTRTVRDSARALDIAAGEESGDSVVAPAPTGTFAEAATREVGRLRIGVMDPDEVNGFVVDATCRKAVRATADLLQSLGHHVEESQPAAMTDQAYLTRWVDLLSPSVTALFGWLETLAGGEIGTDDVGPIARYWNERGAKISAADHVRNEAWRDDYRRRMASWWTGGFDILLTPILPIQAPPLGWFNGDEGLRRSIDVLGFTPQFNTTGQPAMSIPINQTEDGFPVGVQLVGAYGREDLLLGLATQLEAAAPWAHRRPGVGQ